MKNRNLLQIDNAKKQPILSSHQKYRKAAAVAGKIASIVSEVSSPKFRERLEILEALLKHWSLDEDVIIAKKQVTADDEADDQHIMPATSLPEEEFREPSESSFATSTVASS
ncbi:hypothetical protein MTO96_015918 [Rhipicephalus appendiculatus]